MGGDRDHLKTYIANQYQLFFMSTAGTKIEEVLGCVHSCMTNDMNEKFLSPFSGEEVWEALQDMRYLKSPGADGIPVVLYKKFWGLVGDKVEGEVLAVLNGEAMPQGWNETVIVLIPKTSS